MSALPVAAFLVTGLILSIGCWLGWQLLRQNGRILLRLDELEKRLEEFEFDEAAEPASLANGEATDQGNARPHPGPLPREEGEARVDRFSNRSLARSKIKRDGLRAGTPAPDFRLPCLDESEVSLQDFRGRRVLLVFSDPHCGPCNTLAPRLELFHRERPDVSVLMISRGDPKENRSKLKEHRLTFPIALQQRWEISRQYAMFATPIAYIVDENGIIANDVAEGTEAILQLMTTSHKGSFSAHRSER